VRGRIGGLVLNCIVLWNTFYMNAAIERLRAEGGPAGHAGKPSRSHVSGQASRSPAAYRLRAGCGFRAVRRTGG